MRCRRPMVAITLVPIGGGHAGRAADAPGGAAPTGSARRVAQGLLALYTFERPTDDLIRDRSGSGEPLDLKIERRQGIAFRGGRVLVTASTRISSVQPARKIVAAVKQSGGLSIEAWVKPKDVRQA